MSGFRHELIATDGAARRGRLHTAHGTVETPAFMPVGTAGTVKAMLPDHVRATGADIVLGNTYHLMLRPGADRVQRLGGLHKFMNWPGPILTDSGGYQVMSLSSLRKLTEQGVTFQSHIDGSKHSLTPERAIEIQYQLDSTISMCLDECAPYPIEPALGRKSMEMSMRWAERCRVAFRERPGYALFGIVQGGIDRQMRAESADALKRIGFDGYAIGGLAVGEGTGLMLETIDATMPHLPADRPRYLMGVGRPDELVEAVRRGIDMFDCVMPTRSGRTGQAFVPGGVVNLRNARHADDARPLDPACPCPACRGFSRAYLHHLTKSKEMLGPMLLTWHNLQFYQDLMAGLRGAIAGGSLAQFAAGVHAARRAGDQDAETDAEEET
ncbi:MAG: tRNA guanosine(34) transglycosylase Tgt [Alphaproteobacteria bacterium]|nr:tRNA guanosine(34) transglycosylase Tgt [Alphaproteobacteria bacterium]